jgi:hypothetical protein
MFQRVWVGFFQSGQRDVEAICYLLVQFVMEVTPPGFLGNEKGSDFLVAALLVGPFLSLDLRSLESQLFADDLIMSLLENIGAAAEEQHAEDEFLVIRGVHRVAQDICGLVKMAFQLCQGQLAHVSVSSPVRSTVVALEDQPTSS